MHETINTIIALVGAVTGTLALWLERRDSAVRLRVTLEIPQDGRVNTWIEIWNRGRVDAQLDLSSFTLLHQKGQLRAFPLFNSVGDQPFQAKLSPGGRTTLLTSKAFLGRALAEAGVKEDVRLRAQLCDAAGRRFKSKPVRTRVEALGHLSG